MDTSTNIFIVFHDPPSKFPNTDVCVSLRPHKISKFPLQISPPNFHMLVFPAQHSIIIAVSNTFSSPPTTHDDVPPTTSHTSTKNRSMPYCTISDHAQYVTSAP